MKPSDVEYEAFSLRMVDIKTKNNIKAKDFFLHCTLSTILIVAAFLRGMNHGENQRWE